MYDDKCKYIDFRYNKFPNSLVIFGCWLLEDKAREKGLVNVYIFQQPIALSKS